MKLDRVETGGEDRPNEVVVFLENRASCGGFGLPFSISHISRSSFALVVPLSGSLRALVHLRPQPRQLHQLHQPRCGLSLSLSLSLPLLARPTRRRLGTARNCLTSYLPGPSTTRDVVVPTRPASLFAAGDPGRP